MRYLVVVVSAVILIGGFACREKVTESHPSTIYLTVEDVGVTDASLKLSVANATEYDSIVLVRDGESVFSTKFKRQSEKVDTLILDETLLPKHSYTYQLSRYKGRFFFEHTSELKITTMDTTSHSFTWQIDTLGDGISSVLYDIAILSDTLAFAVGEIYKRDSLGQWNTEPYNFLRWDGKNWEMKSITYVPVRAVFAFSENDIWVGTSGPYHWDGTTWKTFKLNGAFNGYVSKFWGTSSNNLYMVGTNGSIAYFNGSSWVKLNSGTTLDIQDIWGSMNNKTGELEIIAVATELFYSERKVLKISGTTVTALPDSGLRTCCLQAGVWFVPGKKYFISGLYIYTKRNPTDTSVWIEDLGSTVYFYNKNAIRGNGINDIVVGVDGGDILHFDGVYWRNFPTVHLTYGTYNSIAIRGNLVIAVGENEQLGVIAIGRR